ncbi:MULTISPECIES: NAD-dependent epimerase/dehydratase family protein [unclassified Prochlorococcus]|uniref:NAD-dependent epimerase/dehydratase family protein n=1 Tax=unclassified Prochlorococcus TaxID=2627481 RepID=UPI00053384E9|nr:MULTISPECIES: NAD-dependent epimerase/dehydratase family protein [unclassified Prochlorococcus]KGG14957.1 ADP-L-glycero-D-manno-heptose-6-epimerase [Prochlorococcus sp. MIT 0602]KGG15608.1 ADP-L-glycero-D-manno-heptose-6-epimerase [Prochlorococcus sp. MIT 0603]
MIILTGHKGFIGKKFLDKISVDVLTIEKDTSLNFRESFTNWKDISLIIHQGAISDTTCTNIKEIYTYNIDYTEWLFKQSIKYQIPIKYASSASVYGNQQGIINPLNYYAISKVIMDYWVQDHIKEFKLVQGFRYFNVYGKGEDHKGDQASPISKFAKQVKENGKLKLFEGSDKFLRDFICVDDVVDIVLNNKKPSGIYDLGTSKPISFQKVGDLIANKYEGQIEYIPFPNHLVGKYQNYTCARDEDWGLNFISVEDYINSL